jgi:dihydroorotase
MPEMLTRFLALGLSLDQVIEMTTANPARALGMGDVLGSLEPGREADISVLEAVSGDWTVSDVKGQTLRTELAIRPVLTVRAGEVITPDWGPHPWGFLPNCL